MRALSSAELLDVWDRGLRQTPLERALTILGAARPDAPPDVLAALDVGRRDALLLELRERTFGTRLTSVVACSQCGERLEFSFGTDDIRVAPVDDASARQLSMEGYEVCFRPPDSRDLAAAALAGADASDAADALDALDPADTPDAQRTAMIARCVIDARRGGEPVPAQSLPAHVVDALEEGMRRAALQADVSIGIACPCCGHEWQAAFDIVSYFWSEIEACARRLLRDVHVLARAYGWHEREILAMSAARRQCYLDMVGA